jgi:hypothetical protein
MTHEAPARLKKTKRNRNTPPEQFKTLAGIEQAIRQQAQETVLPQLALFLQLQHLERVQFSPMNSRSPVM